MKFRDFMLLWETEVKEKGFKFMSDNTCLGYHVSFRATIEVCDFLVSQCHYSFLMTSRLNQDALEVIPFAVYSIQYNY